MNRLSSTRQQQIVAALVDGCSVRATCRITDTAKGTVLRMLTELGTACAGYQDRVLRDLPCRQVKCAKVWSFCYAKEKNIPSHLTGQPGIGSVWTWTALDADSRLAIAWAIANEADEMDPQFLLDVKSRVAVEPQILSTSYEERAHLTLRMGMRRFTRLTNGFSKKIENHQHALALHFMHYNFCRVHQSLRVTPAMEAKLTDHIWPLSELVALVPDKPPAPWGSLKNPSTDP